eukprot:TRINITY_DN1659_c0_g1_i1.p1 TRINITY_DN1659_c0_g1~~TRINITY_DN1659_c0_g1_i1.p1  ORF type:complete len:1208 (-),score=131.23 TRINITY_DN1659_c0_g1_i1:2559-6182(-)
MDNGALSNNKRCAEESVVVARNVRSRGRGLSYVKLSALSSIPQRLRNPHGQPAIDGNAFVRATTITFSEQPHRFGCLIRVGKNFGAFWSSITGREFKLMQAGSCPRDCVAASLNGRNLWICILRPASATSPDPSVQFVKEVAAAHVDYAMLVSKRHLGDLFTPPPNDLPGPAPAPPPPPFHAYAENPVPFIIASHVIDTGNSQSLKDAFHMGHRLIVVSGWTGKTTAVQQLCQKLHGQRCIWYSRGKANQVPSGCDASTVIVADDVDSPEEVFMLRSTPAVIIVTTRNANLAVWSDAGFIMVQFTPWSMAEGMNLLQARVRPWFLDFDRPDHNQACTRLACAFPDPTLLMGIAKGLDAQNLTEVATYSRSPYFVPGLNIPNYIDAMREVLDRVPAIFRGNVEWLLDIISMGDEAMPFSFDLLRLLLARRPDLPSAIVSDRMLLQRTLDDIVNAAEAQSLVMRCPNGLLLPVGVRCIWPFRFYRGGDFSRSSLEQSRVLKPELARELLFCIDILMRKPGTEDMMRHCLAVVARECDAWTPPALPEAWMDGSHIDLSLTQIRAELQRRLQPLPSDRAAPEKFYSLESQAREILDAVLYSPTGVLYVYGASGSGKSTAAYQLCQIARASGQFGAVVYSHRSRLPNDRHMSDTDVPNEAAEDEKALDVAWDLRRRIAFAGLAEEVTGDIAEHVLGSIDTLFVLDNITTVYCRKMVDRWAEKLRANGRRSCVIVLTRFVELVEQRPDLARFELPALSASQAVEIIKLYADISTLTASEQTMLEDAVCRRDGIYDNFLHHPRPLLLELIGRAAGRTLNLQGRNVAGTQLRVLTNLTQSLSQACARRPAETLESGVVRVDAMLSDLMHQMSEPAYRLCRRLGMLGGDAQVPRKMMHVLCFIHDSLVTPIAKTAAEADNVINELVECGFLRPSPEHTTIGQSFFEKATEVGRNACGAAAIGTSMLMWLIHMRKSVIFEQLRDPRVHDRLQWIHRALFNTAGMFDDSIPDFYSQHGLVWRIGRNRELAGRRHPLGRELVNYMERHVSWGGPYDYKQDLRLDVTYKIFVAQHVHAMGEFVRVAGPHQMLLSSWTSVDDERHGLAARHTLLMAVLALTRRQPKAVHLLTLMLEAGNLDPAAMRDTLLKSTIRGHNVLHIAAAKGYDQVVILLLQSLYGGDLATAVDGHGQTPGMLARNLGQEKCAEALSSFVNIRYVQ